MCEIEVLRIVPLHGVCVSSCMMSDVVTLDAVTGIAVITNYELMNE